MSSKSEPSLNPADRDGLPSANGAPTDLSRGATSQIETQTGTMELHTNHRLSDGMVVLVKDSLELMTLLAERGIELPKEDVQIILQASRDHGSPEWTCENHAALASCFARANKSALPATLTSLRFTNSNGANWINRGLVAITVVLLVIVIFLQSLVVKISDVNSKVDTLFSEMDKMSTVSGNIIATISRKNDQINAQLSRLSSIPFLGKRYNSPKTLGGQQALLADAMGWVNALNTLILPSLYGTLGALAFILRNHSASWKAATVSGDFTGEYFIRMVLGLVAGVAIGLFLRPPEGTLEGFAIMTPVALSFIAGYAVELLFGIMDKFVTAFSTSPPSQR